jgi:hypothetical protein
MLQFYEEKREIPNQYKLVTWNDGMSTMSMIYFNEIKNQANPSH